MDNHNAIFVISFICVGSCLIKFNAAGNEGSMFEQRGNRIIGIWYRQVIVRSGLDCCSICAQDMTCRSVNFMRLQLDCQLSNVSHIVIGDYITSDNTTDVYVRTGWQLIFRGTPGTGTDPFIAYRDAVNVTTADIACQQITSTDCPLHYRNPIVDDWSNLGVLQAKYAFYKDGYEAAYVIFNAEGRDFKGWFKNDYIIESSWPDIVGQVFQRFSMAGLTRRFVMNTVLTGDCKTSFSYGVSMSSQHPCAIDVHASYPQFLYSLNDKASTMDDALAFGVADCVAMYIR